MAGICCFTSQDLVTQGEAYGQVKGEQPARKKGLFPWIP